SQTDEGAGAAEAGGGNAADAAGDVWVLRDVRVRDLRDGVGRVQHRYVDVADRSDCGRQHEHSSGVLDVFRDCGSGAVHDGFAAIFRGAADGRIEAKCAAGAAADSAGIRVQERVVFLSRAFARGAGEREFPA